MAGSSLFIVTEPSMIVAVTSRSVMLKATVAELLKVLMNFPISTCFSVPSANVRIMIPSSVTSKLVTTRSMSKSYVSIAPFSFVTVITPVFVSTFTDFTSVLAISMDNFKASSCTILLSASLTPFSRCKRFVLFKAVFCAGRFCQSVML